MHTVLRAVSTMWMPKPVLLSTLRIQREISDDTWNKVHMGAVYCKVHDSEGAFVGNFDYRTSVGQVGGMYLSEQYRYRALEQQMLVYMMKDMQDAGAKKIWEVVPNETTSGHVFYSRLWSFQYSDLCLHPSVTGMGYSMDIPADLRSLLVVPGIGSYERRA